MSNFTLKKDGYVSYTSVSNCFIEQFMPYAAGEFVKIYIYLLKCVNDNQEKLSISHIADVFNNTEKDVVRALKYWEKKGVLKLTFDEDNALTSLYIVSLTDTIENKEANEQNVSISVTDAPVPGNHSNNVRHGLSAAERRQKEDEERAALAGSRTLVIPKKKEYTKSEIDQFSSQDDVAELLFVVQKYLGRTLSGADTNTILYLYDTFGASTELVDYLVQYCVNRNKTSIRYIEKTGLNWADNGIKTVDAAKLMADMYSDECYKVMSAFGLGNRQPTKTEIDFVTRWTISYGFDAAIIVAACGKTIDQKHQPNFAYTDAILKNWKARGVASMEDVERLDKEFENASQKDKKGNNQPKVGKAAAGSKFNNFPQRDYDFEELEKKLLFK